MHGWDAGQELEVIDTEQGVFLKTKSPFPETTLDEVAGSLPCQGKARSLAEMDQAIAYEFSRTDINRALLHLCGLPQVNLAHPQQIAQALTWHQGGLDFADALHLAGSNAQDSFATFDQALIRKSDRLDATPKVFAP